MNRYTVAVLVNNQFGVLNRVTSMFRRRRFNISSLTVSETETSELSRITVVFDGEEAGKQQLINHLYKLPDVCSIKELTDDNSVSFELLLIKMKNEDYMLFRLTETTKRIDDFINLMREFTILEICRTGSVSLERSSTTIRQIINL
jgi:acetolactate synthase-1/3 small subunit